MEDLVRSPDLFVVQVEMDVYTMLKKVNNYTSESCLVCFLALFRFTFVLCVPEFEGFIFLFCYSGCFCKNIPIGLVVFEILPLKRTSTSKEPKVLQFTGLTVSRNPQP